MRAYRILDEDMNCFVVSGKGKTIWAKIGGAKLALSWQKKTRIRRMNEDGSWRTIYGPDRNLRIVTYELIEVQ